MNKLLCAMVLAVASVAASAADKPEMVRLGGSGTLVFVNAANIGEKPLSVAAGTLGNFLMIDVAVRKGSWTMATAKRAMADAKAAAAVFVVKDESLPLSLIAMEERWGVVNAAGLSEKGVEKEALRVASVVIGAASSRYPASALYPVFSVKDVEEKAGTSLTIDSLMALFPNLEAHGIKPYRMMEYREALEEGVAPAPANEAQRQIKAAFETEQKESK